MRPLSAADPECNLRCTSLWIVAQRRLTIVDQPPAWSLSARQQNRWWSCCTTYSCYGPYRLTSVKGKVVPVLFLSEHHVMKVYWEWRYNSTHSLTTALGGGEWPASRTGRFTPVKEPLVPIGYEARWAPEPVWTRCWREKFSAPAGNRTLEPRASNLPLPINDITSCKVRQEGSIYITPKY
jgi:hypothetical protein